MTDIVERLRTEVPCISDIGCAYELCNEAAAEIERLRVALEEIAEENIGNTAAISVYIARAALEGK